MITLAMMGIWDDINCDIIFEKQSLSMLHPEPNIEVQGEDKKEVEGVKSRIYKVLRVASERTV